MYMLERDAESIADHLLGPRWGFVGPVGVKVPALSKPGKLLSRNLLFAADAERGL